MTTPSTSTSTSTTAITTPTAVCPGCGAANSIQSRRCRICARLINRRVPHLDRGLAALHPDTGHGTSFAAAWGRGPSVDPAPTGPSTPVDHGVEVDDAAPSAATDAVATTPDAEEAPAIDAPRWVSFPVEATIPQWEPTYDATDDPSVELAAAIVVDAPLRNGRTPPPLEFEFEPFDPGGLDWDGGTA